MTENQAQMFAEAMAIVRSGAATIEQKMAALFFARDLEDAAAGIPCDCERSTETGFTRRLDGDAWQLSFEQDINLDLHPEAEEDDHAQGR
jgi:hypothetical protein